MRKRLEHRSNNVQDASIFMHVAWVKGYVVKPGI